MITFEEVIKYMKHGVNEHPSITISNRNLLSSVFLEFEAEKAEMQAQLKAKDEEINHLKCLLHIGDENGAEINIRIGNRYARKLFSVGELDKIILLDQYLKDTFENLLETIKDR